MHFNDLSVVILLVLRNVVRIMWYHYTNLKWFNKKNMIKYWKKWGIKRMKNQIFPKKGHTCTSVTCVKTWKKYGGYYVFSILIVSLFSLRYQMMSFLLYTAIIIIYFSHDFLSFHFTFSVKLKTNFPEMHESFADRLINRYISRITHKTSNLVILITDQINRTLDPSSIEHFCATM